MFGCCQLCFSQCVRNNMNGRYKVCNCLNIKKILSHRIFHSSSSIKVYLWISIYMSNIQYGLSSWTFYLISRNISVIRKYLKGIIGFVQYWKVNMIYMIYSCFLHLFTVPCVNLHWPSCFSHQLCCTIGVL